MDKQKIAKNLMIEIEALKAQKELTAHSMAIVIEILKDAEKLAALVSEEKAA